MDKRNQTHFQALIEEATVDCCNEDEQLTGIFTKLEEHLELPFETSVLGAPVTVKRIDLRVATADADLPVPTASRSPDPAVLAPRPGSHGHRARDPTQSP